jgi:hypothetical protein
MRPTTSSASALPLPCPESSALKDRSTLCLATSTASTRAHSACSGEQGVVSVGRDCAGKAASALSVLPAGQRRRRSRAAAAAPPARHRHAGRRHAPAQAPAAGPPPLGARRIQAPKRCRPGTRHSARSPGPRPGQARPPPAPGGSAREAPPAPPGRRWRPAGAPARAKWGPGPATGSPRPPPARSQAPAGAGRVGWGGGRWGGGAGLWWWGGGKLASTVLWQRQPAPCAPPPAPWPGSEARGPQRPEQRPQQQPAHLLACRQARQLHHWRRLAAARRLLERRRASGELQLVVPPAALLAQVAQLGYLQGGEGACCVCGGWGGVGWECQTSVCDSKRGGGGGGGRGDSSSARIYPCGPGHSEGAGRVRQGPAACGRRLAAGRPAPVSAAPQRRPPAGCRWAPWPWPPAGPPPR